MSRPSALPCYDIDTVKTFLNTLPLVDDPDVDINTLIPFVATELFARHIGLCNDELVLRPLTTVLLQAVYDFTHDHISVTIEENDTAISYIRMFIAARYIDESLATLFLNDILSRKHHHRRLWRHATSFCYTLSWLKDISQKKSA